MFDLATGDVRAERQVFGKDTSVVRFSPGGNGLAAAGHYSEACMVETDGLSPVWEQGEDGFISGPVCFSAAGRVCYMHTGSAISTRDAATGELIARTPCGVFCRIAPEGGIFAERIDASSVRVADVITGETRHVFTATTVEPATEPLGSFTTEMIDELNRAVCTYHLSPDGRYLAVVTTSAQVTICDLESGRPVFSRRMNTVECFRFLPGGRFAWTPDYECEAEVRDIRTKRVERRVVLDDIDCVFPNELYVSGDGRVAVVRVMLSDPEYDNEYRARAWDLERGVYLFTERGIDHRHTLALSRDGRTAVSGREEGHVRAWTVLDRPGDD